MQRVYCNAETGMILPALALLAAGQAQAAPPPVPSRAPDEVRCVFETHLGSRTPRKVCRTQREWEELRRRKPADRSLNAFHPKNGGVGFTNN
jgi:hypothetical protein